MADWKQITARIRRARSGKDPAAQLSTLFEKTRDAMVAFELARFFETSGQNSDAAKWYVTAAERFRRADWKAKAQEAAVRLGAEVAAASASDSSAADQSSAVDVPPAGQVPAVEPSADSSASRERVSPLEETATAAGTDSDAPAERKRRRRGKRGGRNRRKGEASPGSSPSSSQHRATHHRAQSVSLSPAEEPSEPESPRPIHPRAIPTLPLEPAAESGMPGVRGRSGDPGLSSRLSLLEMQLRRLLTCTPVKLSDADHAPAGPGVLLLTDSDLTSYYYAEACQTLRIAVANLLRGGASRRGEESIKPRLAEHLGIPESRVAKYLADHCVVRWLQLDEGASYFAHFVIAVIRPTLNE